VLVAAMPLKAVMMSFSDTNAAKEVKGSVPRRGLCGDVYLVSTPSAARIDNVKVDTSVRNGQITVSADLQGLAERGIDLATITRELEEDGVAKFAASYRSLLAGIEAKAGELVGR